MTTEEAITEIMKIREAMVLEQVWNSPDHLSRASLKLATYNSYVADDIGEAYGDYRQMEEDAKIARQEFYLELRTKNETQGDSEAQARVVESEKNKESIEIRKQHIKLEKVYESTDALINAIKKRINVIENQMAREGNNE